MTTFDIKKIRAKLNMTQQELAVALGVSLSTVANWESGRSNPSRLAITQIQGLLRSSKSK